MSGDHAVALSERAGVPNAAWTWFTDARAIVDADAGADGPRLLVGGVTAPEGDVVVHWYDVGADAAGHAVLHAGFEADDHDGPALLVRPDGRYLAMYARHGTDPYTRWRVSTEPHDPTDWRPERRLDNGAEVTYCNVYRLPGDAGGDGRTYCFTRATDWDPHVLASTDAGSTWRRGGRLLAMGNASTRPYLRYCAHGERIHCLTTEGHPHDVNNGIYHGSVQDGTLHDSGDGVVTGDVLDGSEEPARPTDLTAVFEPGTTVAGRRMTHGWTVDAATDDAGRPVAVFQARVDGDPADHQFCYARYQGSAWRVHHLAAAGGHLYDTQYDYTGLAAIDPDAANRVIVSAPVDPRSGEALARYQLFAGDTSDGGATWEWRALTPDASRDNLRPVVPRWRGDRAALVWMRGAYAEYTDWETRAVARLGW